MVATVVKETLQQGRTIPVDEMKEVSLVEVAPTLESMAQSSRGATSTYHVKKGIISFRQPPLKQIVTCQMLFSNDILKEELSPHFRPPHINEYNGNMDPKEHLVHFKNSTLLY